MLSLLSLNTLELLLPHPTMTLPRPDAAGRGETFEVHTKHVPCVPKPRTEPPVVLSTAQAAKDLPNSQDANVQASPTGVSRFYRPKLSGIVYRSPARAGRCAGRCDACRAEPSDDPFSAATDWNREASTRRFPRHSLLR